MYKCNKYIRYNQYYEDPGPVTVPSNTAANYSCDASNVTDNDNGLGAWSGGADKDVIVIRQILEGAGVLSRKDAVMTVAEMRGYVRGRVSR